jgi:two-component SAPR family response regulator
VFQRLLEQIDREEKIDTVQMSLLKRAIELYKGAFLEEDVDGSWVIEPRERLRNKYVRAVQAVATQYENNRDWTYAVECYESAIDVEALSEPLYLKLVRCHIEMGQPGEALITYERYRKLLAVHFGIAPSEMAQGIARELRERGMLPD